MRNLSRRGLLSGAVAAGAALAARRLAFPQGVPLGELQEPLDIDELRERLQADDPVDLAAVRAARWSEERAHQYMERFGIVNGIGYNATRLGGVWREWNEAIRWAVLGSGVRPRIQYPDQDFHEQVVDEELGWANDIYGINSIRVWLPAARYQADREDFFGIFETFLDIAARNGMSVMPILGMRLRDPAEPPPPPPDPNPEYEFLPGVWSGGFRQRRQEDEVSEPPEDTGSQASFDRFAERWPRVKPLIREYQQTMLSRYAGDERIILWDLLNEPQTWERPAVEYLFQWAREVDPPQPLSVCWNGHDLSDVITFHTYMQPGLTARESAPGRVDFLAELNWATSWNRPALCTEWLARPFGNRVENVLPFFSRYGIGHYMQSLVAGGPLQGQYPWVWPIGSPEPPEWFHCLFYPDGRPYSYEEVYLIRNFEYRAPPRFVNTQQYFNQNGAITGMAPPIP